MTNKQFELNKKGIFSVIFVFLIALLITYATYLFFYSEKSNSYIRIGESSSDIYKSFSVTEKYLFFIDQSAKFSFDNMVGNLKLETGCGFKENYPLLLLGDQTCFLSGEHIESLLNNSFNTYISQYLVLYNDLDLKSIPFDIKFEENYIYGKSDTIIESKMNNISQKSKPSFITKRDFNIKEVILESTQEVRRLYTLCKSDKNCWESNKKDDTIVEYKGKFFIVHINKNLKYGLDNKNLKLDFGLDFETNPLFR